MESIKLICNPMIDLSKYLFNKKLWSTIITQTGTSFLKKKKFIYIHIYIYIYNLNVTHTYVFNCVYFNKITVKLNFTLFLVYPKFVIKKLKTKTIWIRKKLSTIFYVLFSLYLTIRLKNQVSYL